MNNTVYRDLELDKIELKKLLKKLNNQIDRMQNSINNLENAIEHGRCVTCSEPLCNKNSELCQECLDENIEDLNEFIKEGI